MTGHGNGDRAQEDLLRRALTDAMDGATGPEPGMPDLLGPAMAEGTRIRRRRRATLLVALSTAAVLVGGGVAGGFAYVGGQGGQSVQVPPGGQPSTGRQSGAAELTALIDAYLAPRGWTAHPAPLEVRTDSAGGKTVRILVRPGEYPNARGAVLELSVAAMPRPPAAGQSIGDNCETLAKLDPSGPESAQRDGVVCRFVGRKDQLPALAWEVTVKQPADAAASRLWGNVRIGADKEIVRAWSVIDYFPATPNPGSPPFDEQVFAALTADPRLAGLVRALSDAPAAPSMPSGTTNP
ncbi:MAG: hypothetical protein HOU01_20010 [Streptomycetaceae bacterium]|nr:hypothetical protein [Streptomycetaceae bacterium]